MWLSQDGGVRAERGRCGLREKAALEDLKREQATDGRHLWFKSMQTFDSQYHRDQHGFQSMS